MTPAFYRSKPTSRLRAVYARPGLVLFIGGIALLLFGLALVFVPIELTYTISTKGQLSPAREWILALDANGHLKATLHNHVHGTPEDYALAQFDRQDAVRFSMHPDVASRSFIEAGDTVGVVHSNLTERKMAELLGQLSTEQAALEFYASGEKSSVIEEARNELRRAEAKVAEQKRVVERMRALKEKDATSIQDLELAESNLLVYEYDVTIAEARLESAQTGAKPEQLNFIRSRIHALQDEIEALNRRSDHFTLVAPLSGATHKFAMSDTLMVVADTAAYVVFMPIPWAQRSFMKTGQRVMIGHDAAGNPVEGTLIRMDNYVRTIGYKQAFMAVALVQPESSHTFVPGMITSCTVLTDTVRPLEYIRRLVQSTFNQLG